MQLSHDVGHEKLLRALSSKNQEPAWLQALRKESLEHFSALPWPEFKYGKGIVLDAHELDFTISPGTLAVSHSSSDGIEVLSFKDAYVKYPQLLQEKFMSLLQNDEDKFTALHGALFDQGQLILVKDGTVLQEPFAVQKMFGGSFLTHTLIVVGNNCEVTFLEQLTSTHEERGLISNCVEIIVGTNSRVHFFSAQQLGTMIFYHTSNQGVVGKDSRLDWFMGHFGGSFTKSSTSTILQGEGSQTNNYGLFFGDQRQQFDLYVSTIHAAPHTTSDMLMKGVVKDKSKSMYRGMIEVKENAAETNGYQKEDVLILDPTAEANAVPRLEIGNNNVRCTHGTTIGQIDKEKLFYLKSRGIEQHDARKIMVDGFFEHLLSKIPVASFTAAVRDVIQEKL